MLKYSIAHAVSLVNILDSYKLLGNMYRLLIKHIFRSTLGEVLEDYGKAIARKRGKLLKEYGVTRDWSEYVLFRVDEGYDIFDEAPLVFTGKPGPIRFKKTIMTKGFYDKFAYAYYKYLVKHKRNVAYFVPFTLPIMLVHLFRQRNKSKNQEYKQKYLITKFRRVDYCPLHSTVKVQSKLIYPELFYTDDVIMESLRVVKHSYTEHLFNPYTHFKYRTHVKVIHSIEDGVEIIDQLTADYKRDSMSITNFYKKFIKNSFRYLTNPE